MVRTTVAPESLSASIVRIVREIDPEQPVLNTMSIDATRVDPMVTLRAE